MNKTFGNTWFRWIFHKEQFGRSSDCEVETHNLISLRQGCVLIPHLSCVVLRGFDMSRGVLHLILLRFANEIVCFFLARSAIETGKLWDRLVAELPKMGPVLNAARTVRSTTQTQPRRIMKWLCLALPGDVVHQPSLPATNQPQTLKAFHPRPCDPHPHPEN